MRDALDQDLEHSRTLGFTDVVILWQGETVRDWHAEGQDRVNFIFSCTKSVLSVGFGILLEQYPNLHLDDSLVQHLPQARAQHEPIRIRNLLSMTSGLSWSDMRVNFDYDKMVKSDWMEYVLAKPVVQEKIGQFHYCDGNSLLLSAIITHYTHRSAHEFLRETLFDPLGIGKTTWKEQNGITMGGTGLHMRSFDLAKIGSLMLEKGRFLGRPLVSPGWIDQSTAVQSAGYPDWFGHYGYHWWTTSVPHQGQLDLFFALGAHGQFLFVIPEKKLVVCIRKKVGKLSQMHTPMEFLYRSILPSITEEKGLS